MRDFDGGHRERDDECLVSLFSGGALEKLLRWQIRNILLYSSMVEHLRDLNRKLRGWDEEYLALEFIGGALEKLAR